MGQCVTRPVQPKPKGRRLEKTLSKKGLPRKFERALTYREKYGGSEVLGTDDFQSVEGMPEELHAHIEDSAAFDSVQNSPDSASTGMGTSRKMLTGSGDPLPQERAFPMYPLKPQTPFLEEESDCLSDTTDIQQEMVASMKERGDTWLPSASNQSPDPVDNLDIWEFKEKLLERIKRVLQKKEPQVSLVNRDHKQRVPSSRLPSAPRYSKHHVSETTGNVRSIPEEQQHVAKRATTMPIKRKTSEDHQKLVTTHSWSGTRDAGPKAGDDNKVVQAETLELAQMHLQFDSDAMIPEEPESTSLGSDSASKDSRLVMSLPKISSDDVWKIEGGDLGRGVSGSVCLCCWNGVEVAVKEWHGLFNQWNQNSMLQEADTLGMLRHPCVVQIFGISSMGGSPATVMEYVLHGSLQSKLRHLKAQGGIGTDQKVAIALRVAQGMQFLHSQNIIHFDLKAANLLCDLRDPERPVVKIADVGLSKLKLDTYVSGNMRGTLPWMAPELFPSLDSMPDVPGVMIDKVDEKVDVYSFAVVLWEIWTLGEDPYQGLSTADVLYGLMSRSLRPEIPTGCEPFWGDLLMRCWHHDPSERPTFEEITKELDVNLLDRDLTMV